MKPSNREKLVVLFNAPPSSGKDAAVDFLTLKYSGHKHQMKDELYKETAKLFGLNPKWFIEQATDRETKEVPNERIMVAFNDFVIPLSPRRALIIASEFYIKTEKGKDYFGKCCAKSIEDSDAQFHFLSDGGFEEEIKPLVDKGYNVVIVKISRNGCSFSGDSRNYISYDAMKRLGVKECYHICNDETLDQYLESVDNLFIKILENHNLRLENVPVEPSSSV